MRDWKQKIIISSLVMVSKSWWNRNVFQYIYCFFELGKMTQNSNQKHITRRKTTSQGVTNQKQKQKTFGRKRTQTLNHMHNNRLHNTEDGGMQWVKIFSVLHFSLFCPYKSSTSVISGMLPLLSCFHLEPNRVFYSTLSTYCIVADAIPPRVDRNEYLLEGVG